MNSKQSGFSIVEGVIAIMVIGIFGFIGWTVYNTYTSKPTKVTSQTTSINNTTKQPATNNNQPAQTVDPNAGFFVIKEWNVRFKPASGLTNLKYTIKAFDTDSNADFTTTQVNALDSHCDPSLPNGFSGIGSISRIATSEQQPTTGIGRPLLATINSYNYYGEHPQATCLPSNASSSDTSTLSNISTEFFNSITTLQAAQ